jgi:N4-gp56 family major capsid protein
MAVTTTSVLTNSVQAKYQAAYIMAVKTMLYYDQLSYVVEKANMIKGSSIKVPFLFDLPPNVTAVSQTSDITPRTFTDKLFTVTPDLYGDAVQLSEKLRRTAFTDVEKGAAELVGRQAGKSVDYLARTAATQGTWVGYGGSATSRSTCDASNDQISYADFITSNAFLSDMGAEPIANGKFTAVLGQPVLKDILEDSVIQAIGSYQKGEILLNGEIGSIAGSKIVVTNWSKRFYGAGAANDSIATTVATTAIVPGDVTFAAAADTSISVGDWLTFGSIESSTTEYPETELVQLVGGSSGAWQIVGGGSNGGFKFAHAIGDSIKDNDTVHAVCFYGKNSIGKVFAPDTGALGKVLPPKTTGMLDQFMSLPWKAFVGYARVAENRMRRLEVATSKHN